MNAQRLQLVFSALLVAIGVLSITRADAAESPPATQVVQQMTNYLKSLQQFSYHAEVTYDGFDNTGNKVQRVFNMDTSVQRPDRLRVSADGEDANKEFYYDGKSIVLYDKTAKVYGVAKAPSGIEPALAKAQKEFNLRVALTDLASPKLYQHISKSLPTAKNLGTETVEGVQCTHLAFDHNKRNVQLWVSTGNKPLLQKISITAKSSQGDLHWTAMLSAWNVAAKFDSSVFTFVAPANAKKIRFLPAHPTTDAGKKSQPTKGGK